MTAPVTRTCIRPFPRSSATSSSHCCYSPARGAASSASTACPRPNGKSTSPAPDRPRTQERVTPPGRLPAGRFQTRGARHRAVGVQAAAWPPYAPSQSGNRRGTYPGAGSPPGRDRRGSPRRSRRLPAAAGLHQLAASPEHPVTRPRTKPSLTETAGRPRRAAGPGPRTGHTTRSNSARAARRRPNPAGRGAARGETAQRGGGTAAGCGARAGLARARRRRAATGRQAQEVREVRRWARTAGRPGRATGGLRTRNRTAAGRSGRGVGTRASPGRQAARRAAGRPVRARRGPGGPVRCAEDRTAGGGGGRTAEGDREEAGGPAAASAVARGEDRSGQEAGSGSGLGPQKPSRQDADLDQIDVRVPGLPEKQF
ncbi:hypothetical protein SCANM63S_04922 [Streptomyces canarius]